MDNSVRALSKYLCGCVALLQCFENIKGFGFLVIGLVNIFQPLCKWDSDIC